MSDEDFVEGARKLQRQWFSELRLDEAINQAFDRIGFTDAYVDTCLKCTGDGKRKAIKDSVWGMMEFNAGAMRLIDLPILQRLRRIHQLGFSSLTYPSAEHSRFIHSVGMAHVVRRFAEALDRDHEDLGAQLARGISYATTEELAPLRADELTHAALLHDVGHLPFSHASENALELGPDQIYLRRQAAK